MNIKKLLTKKEPLVIPAAFDAITTKIIEKAGFKALFVAGSSFAAAYLAKPDVYLMTLTEVLDETMKICEAVNIPVLVDVETGYGNYLNISRVVREYEKIGVAGILIDDRKWPSKELAVISETEMMEKIKTVKETRTDKNFVIVVTTYAKKVYNLEEAIRRGKQYSKAGIDVIYIEGLTTSGEMSETAEAFNIPVMATMIEDGDREYLKVKQLSKMGFKVIAYPLTSLYASVKAVIETMRELKIYGTIRNPSKKLVSAESFNELLKAKKNR
ncbi:MAG: hypothetical protein A2044_06125 [Candidatus Firestonebacteria bacterium GWA2_43_8]|nr:MAG: hypothetical protein A2044_06125 [Candidatus Firestonebacteria bacterium GWA2_43_8]